MKARSLSCEEPLKEEMATHSNILAWKIPWLEESGRLQCMGVREQRRKGEVLLRAPACAEAGIMCNGKGRGKKGSDNLSVCLSPWMSNRHDMNPQDQAASLV